MLKEIADDAKQHCMPYVIVGQPRRDLTETPAQNFDGVVIHIDLLGFTRAFVNIEGEKVDVARNYLLDVACESDSKYLLFVGEDTVLPYDAFTNLHATAEANPGAMVVGVYYIKLSSPMLNVVQDRMIVPADVTPGQVIEIYSCGLDCALIPIKLLKELKQSDPELPFCVTAMGIKDAEGNELPFIGEDNFFTYRWKKAGHRILCNTNVQCLHMDLATGKYTAHPSVQLENYFTNIPITEPLTMKDKLYIDKRWVDRLPEGSGKEVEVGIQN